MECKRCLITEDIQDIKLTDGVCNFCRLHDELEEQSKKFNLNKFINKLKKTKNKYHCLIGISGGLDSSFMLEYSVKTLGLNPLVIHFDNGWNTEIANKNIEIMVKSMDVDFIRYQINNSLYNEVCRALLLASVPDADIANDMVMAEMMVRTARQYKIKYIFNGHDFKHEGSSPLAWTYMDAKYVESIYEKYIGKELKNFPMIGFWGQVYNRVKQFRLLYYVDFNPQKEKDRLIKTYGWSDYGEKHSENIYTWFVGACLLPKKFNIDKRITYLSARIRSGEITKTEAKKILISPINYKGFTVPGIMEVPINSRKIFKSYHEKFKRYRWLMWILMKTSIVPKTFYIKYCK